MERSFSCINFEASLKSVPDAIEQTKSFAGSRDNLKFTNAEYSLQHLPPNKPLRKKKLQRQQSAIDIDDMNLDMDIDTDYVADLEDEVEDAIVIQHLPKYLFQPIFCHHPNAKLKTFQRHTSCSSTNSSIYSSTNTSKSQSLISPTSRCLRHEDSFESYSTAAELSPLAQRQQRFSSKLLRDSSVHSDSSHYSSVDSLLESRKPDPEAILINLGFGSIGSDDILSRIPKRFLKPSQVRGIDTEAFIKRLQLVSSLADSSVLGYRGLTGNPDMPPSSIVAKIMERFEVNHRKQSIGFIDHTTR